LTEFPKNIKFKYSWRKYQQRVLDELEEHLNDKHLHVIAPPGSGKTVLGLEVALRLNKPTLILAPTLAIRDQWIQRFCELFLDSHNKPDWISKDIRNPGFMTVTTYQGLHAACNNFNIVDVESDDEIDEEAIYDDPITTYSELNSILSGLESIKIGSIVVDEAHHLKREWWNSLTKVKDKLDPIIVGLTATPPYDAPNSEWMKYIELNGPVDTEISIPELVIEGDLCPHQDYIYFTSPSEIEHNNILDFRDNMKNLFDSLKKDEILSEAVSNHPIIINPTENLDWIYTNFQYYASCLIFLNSIGIGISDIHRRIIGDERLEIPLFDYHWIEILLEFYLYKDEQNFERYKEHKLKVKNRLRRYGAMERRKIKFMLNKRISSNLNSSISKLSAIKNIVNFEHNQLRNDLRLVILTDYIRLEYLVNSDENNLDLNKIGVIPIFEQLRRDISSKVKISVLTGSIIIIPSSILPAFKSKALKYGIPDIKSKTVPYDDNYVVITRNEQLKHYLVNIVTQLFQTGEFEVLIGTKSLLGEGWDAPAMNTLILASFVGSYVLSNQMRGRAIRAQNGNLDKTANIWHLVCIDPTDTVGGDDFDLLKRRFRSFVGVSSATDIGIENGINRLNIPENIFQKADIDNYNSETFALAADRESLKLRWLNGLKNGTTLVEEIKIPLKDKREYEKIKKLYVKKTIANLLTSFGFGLMAFLEGNVEWIIRSIKNIKNTQDIYTFLTYFGLSGALVFGVLAYKTLKIFIKYRDIAKDIQQIGYALLETLIEAGLILSDKTNLHVISSVDNNGAVFCHLNGGTSFEKSTFINALQEIISPIDNPRYVIVRKSAILYFIKQLDYHAVPEIIGKNKALSEYFKNQWKKNVGPCDLIYTRTIDGRKLLLSSRVKSLSAELSNQIEHVNKWR
jgi:superfamily II DNA or RNA helicase